MSDQELPPEDLTPKRHGLGFGARLRNYFLAGILITAPVSLTIYIAWLFINWVDQTVLPLVPPEYNPENYLPFSIPGIGLIIVLITLTLIELGFVKTDEKDYWLTPKVLRLCMTYLYTLPFWRQSQQVLEELGTRVQQSCAVSVLDDGEIVYIQRFHTKRILAFSPSTGSRLPAYAVSMGRVLLAHDPVLDAPSPLTDAEIDDLVEFIRALRGAPLGPDVLDPGLSAP